MIRKALILISLRKLVIPNYNTKIIKILIILTLIYIKLILKK